MQQVAYREIKNVPLIFVWSFSQSFLCSSLSSLLTLARGMPAYEIRNNLRVWEVWVGWSRGEGWRVPVTTKHLDNLLKSKASQLLYISPPLSLTTNVAQLVHDYIPCPRQCRPPWQARHFFRNWSKRHYPHGKYISNALVTRACLFAPYSQSMWLHCL